MKKYIFSVLMAAMAAFTFSSCEDVPAPYNSPSQPENPDTPDTPAGEAKGTGTAADPFNCAAAAAYCKSLGSGVESTNDVYIKGKIKSIEEAYNASYGNCSVTLVDEGTSATFKVWRAYYFNNKKWTADGKELKEGDEVVFCGKVVNYQGNTPETVQSKAYLISINGESGTENPDTPVTGEAKGDGTEANPFNSVAATKEASKLATGEKTTDTYYIKGKIQEVKYQYSTKYGSASVYIADDDKSTTFYVYGLYYFGGEKWKEGDTELKVGDEIVVCCQLLNYNGTLETNQGGKLISLNGKTSGETKPDTPDTPDTPSGETYDNGTFETWESSKPTNWNTNSAGNATVSQSEDAHGGKYSVNVAGASSNKRLGYKAISLKAGTYTMKFYAKAGSDKGASLYLGYVAVNDGTVDSQNYKYNNNYVSVTNSEWTLVEQEITISADGTYSVVIMNSKKPGGDVLIDDFTLTLNGTAIIK